MQDNIDLNVQFCEEIRKYPCLFDFNRGDYSNKSIQDKVWQRIADKFGLQVADCKDRWKNIRGSYTKHKKNLKLPSGSGARRPKEYYLASHLQFLDSFLKTRSSKYIVGGVLPTQQEAENSADGTLNGDIDEEAPETEVTNLLISDSTSSTPLPSSTPEQNSTGGYRKRERSPVTTLQDVNTCTCFETKKRLLEQRQEGNTTDTPDPDMAFFQSILPDMRTMNDRQKRRFKIGILRLADEILYPQHPISTGTSTKSAMSMFDDTSQSTDHIKTCGDTQH